MTWIKRTIVFYNTRHPKEMGENEISTYLTLLADKAKVSASTQKQAFSALLFLYRDVLRIKLSKINNIYRPKRSHMVPVVCTTQEAKAVLNQLHEMKKRVAGLLYGAGLWIMECIGRRVQNVYFEYKQILIRDGKG